MVGDVLLYVKLIFNVIDIIEVVRGVEVGGVDGLFLINIVLGLYIDICIG